MFRTSLHREEDNKVRCAFHFDRSDWELDSGCQFNVSQAELTEYQDQMWCPFHLPIGKFKGQKMECDEAKIQAFNEKIFSFIEDAQKKGKKADLSGVVFPGQISFERYISEANGLPEVLFLKALFDGGAYFGKAMFSSHVWFNEAIFNSDVEFDNAAFGGNALFDKTLFNGNASFDKVIFNNGAWFAKAVFSSNAMFDRTTFSDYAWFNEATFGGNAWFNEASFNSEARFGKACFGNDAVFNKAVFNSDARFGKATFSGNAWFNEAAFNGYAGFKKTTFNGDAEFSASVRKALTGKTGAGSETAANSFFEVSFYDAKFYGRVRFTNRCFLDTTDFRGGFFRIAPEFYNCILHQDTNFSGRDFQDRGRSFRDRQGTIVEVDAVRAYRTLKLAMENVRARTEEAQFFALEQQSLRAKKNTPFWVKVFSWLYEKIADYGQSFIRPLAWLIGTFFLFFLIYLALMVFMADKTVALADVDQVLRFALQQIFYPFQTWRMKHEAAFPVPLSIALLASLHSLFNLSFIGLFLLGLRRRFMLG